MKEYTYWKTPSTNVLRRINGLNVDVWFLSGEWRHSFCDSALTQRTSIKISENDAKHLYPEAFK